MRYMIRIAMAALILSALATVLPAQNLLANGSFEQNFSSWTRNGSYNVQIQSSGWNGVSAVDGSKFVAVSGPADIGSTYVEMVAQTRSAPFGPGVPTDSFILYLFAYTYLHTTDGRDVSYTVMLEPGYGQMGPSFRGGGQDRWVVSQTTGYYGARDPFDPTSSTKPIRVYLQLHEPLNAGEYLLLDNVILIHGGTGTPEPAAALQEVAP